MNKYESIRDQLEKQIANQHERSENIKVLLQGPQVHRSTEEHTYALIYELGRYVVMQSYTNNLVGQLITLLDSRIEN